MKAKYLGSLKGTKSSTFSTQRFRSAGFLRSNELLNIRCSDVIFEESLITIFIERSKTDIYRDGQWKVIARTESEMCSVKYLEMFFKWCGFSSNGSDFIFRNMSKTK